jgi:hypothetical protein
MVHDARRPIIAINITNTFGGDRRALYRIKLQTNAPFKIIPITAVIHKNMPVVRTISQLIGVGRFQNRGSSDERCSSMIEE